MKKKFEIAQKSEDKDRIEKANYRLKMLYEKTQEETSKASSTQK
ncbi:hypothetical protein [Xenorhabdus hominickii]|nr:hypothetical protein [Xenorhabdus hominickii]